GEGVDAAIGRCGDDLVAALAQNGDGLRADQAGAADNDDLHGLPSLVDALGPLAPLCSSKTRFRALCAPPDEAISRRRSSTSAHAVEQVTGRDPLWAYPNLRSPPENRSPRHRQPSEVQ